MPTLDYTPNSTPANKKKTGRKPQIFLTSHGKTQSIQDWALETGLSEKLIYNRLTITKWPIERALLTPPRKHIKHGLSRHPLKGTWNEMIRRCYNPKAIYYCYYGAKHVVVCQGWHDLSTFLRDVGDSPPRINSRPC